MSDVDKQQETTKKPGGRSGKGFVKGDPRINRKGRPKSFDKRFVGRVFITMNQTIVGELPHDMLTEVGFSRAMLRMSPALCFATDGSIFWITWR